MSWRDTTWELMVAAASWIAMLGALIFVAAYLVVEAYQRWRQR